MAAKPPKYSWLGEIQTPQAGSGSAADSGAGQGDDSYVSAWNSLTDSVSKSLPANLNRAIKATSALPGGRGRHG